MCGESVHLCADVWGILEGLSMSSMSVFLTLEIFLLSLKLVAVEWKLNNPFVYK